MASPETSAPEPEAEGQRLADLHAYEILDTAPEQTYDDLTRLAAKVCERPMAAITFIDEHRQWVKAEIGGGAQTSPRSESFCAHAIADPESVFVVEDTAEHPAFEDNPYVTGEPHLRFYAGAPVRSHRGHGLGTICVLDTEPGQLTTDQEEALMALSRTVSLQLELRRQGRELRRVTEDMELLASAVDSDLREDLDVVRTALQALASEAEGPEVEAELRKGKRATRQLGRTIAHLGEYARIAGRRDPMDALALSDAVEEAKSELEAKGVEGVRVEAHGLPEVWADPHQVSALLRKLVVLLADLGTTGSPIHVTAHRGEDRWRIELSTAVEELRETQRAALRAGLANREPAGGSGSDTWGLILCRRIVERHGGEIGFEDTDEQLGIWFTLPGPSGDPSEA